jgi:DNA-binding NarL/FixJ family response regulator
MKKITVFLCDDHNVVRDGLRLLLEAARDIEVLGEAENGYCAVAETKRLKPNVVLMDIGMALLNGMEAARKITREVPATKVLILSSYSDDQHVRQAIEAGAAGYVVKESAAQELFGAIRETCKGNTFFSPPIARRLLQQWRNREFLPRSTAAAALSTRQAEIVQLISEGYATKQIAGLLFLSKKTVEKHRQRLMETLNIHNIANLTRYAVSNGIVESNRAPDRPFAPIAIRARVRPMQRPAALRDSVDAKVLSAVICERADAEVEAKTILSKPNSKR